MRRVKARFIASYIRKHKQGSLTQQEFADKLGVSRQLVSSITNGREKPSDAVLKKMKMRKVDEYEDLEI